MKRYAHIAARIFGNPLAMEPRKLEAMLAGIADRFGIEGPKAATIPDNRPRERNRYKVIDGVAVIDVFGALAHRVGAMDADSTRLTSYQDVGEDLRAALSDPNAKSILLALDSPGGECSGAFDLADQVFNARGIKPIAAVAEDLACSAAYLIGAAAGQFFATQSATVGSIGVVLALLDQSEAEAKVGIKVNHIHAGARKIDGNPHSPLGGDAREALQTHVNGMYDLFVSKISKFREMPEDMIRSTEAGIYIGNAAVEAGLIDGIRSAADSLTWLRAQSVGALRMNAGGDTFTVVGVLDQEARVQLASQLTALRAKEDKGSKMEGLKALQEEVARLKAEAVTAETAFNALKAEGEGMRSTIVNLNDSLRALHGQRKLDCIARHEAAGRLTPVMIDMVRRGSESLTVEQLDAELTKMPVLTHPKGDGSLITVQPAVAENPTDVLKAKAAELCKADPKLSEVDAFNKACFLNPGLYAGHRAANTPTRRIKK